jgi:hypothetical protein
VRAQRGSLTGDLEWQVCVGEERNKGEGREGADAWDRPGRGRKGERALGLGIEGDWAERGSRGERRGRGNGLRGERAGPGGRRGRRADQAAGLGCLPFFLLLSFFFSTLKLLKQFYLNSNKFEFKPYTLNTNKQCSSMNAQTS